MKCVNLLQIEAETVRFGSVICRIIEISYLVDRSRIYLVEGTWIMEDEVKKDHYSFVMLFVDYYTGTNSYINHIKICVMMRKQES